MKKNLFLVLISVLLILILIYFYDKKEFIMNKEYIKDNIYIEYPYFDNHIIDSYINNYLNDKIEKYNGSSLFMDYDYIFEDNIVNLSLYTYSEDENKVTYHTKNLAINLDTLRVKAKEESINTSYEYYAYSNRMIDTQKPMIALTFDDGPNHNTNKILDILDKYHAKATFFVLGSNIKENEETIKRMHSLNMEIGNHTFSHKLLSKLSKEKISEEIKKTDDLIFDIIGTYPTLLRPSYGTVNKKIKSLADRPIIIWDIDTLDWKYHNSKKIASKVLKKAKDGDIILMHDIYSATANSLDIIIPKLLKEGYQFVTITELFYYKNLDLEKGKVYGYAR